MPGGGERQRRAEAAFRAFNTRSHKDVADCKLRIESSAKTGAHYSGELSHPAGNLESGCRLGTPGAIGKHQDLTAIQARRSPPSHGPGKLLRRMAKPQESGKFSRLGGNEKHAGVRIRRNSHCFETNQSLAPEPHPPDRD